MNKLFPTAVIGSMPRPKYLQEFLDPQHKTKITAYQDNLDNSVKFIAQLQEYAGIDIISDGEWRRLSYIGVIADLLQGFTVTLKDGIWWHTVTEKLAYKNKGLFAEEAVFLSKNTKAKIKVAIPSPYLIGSRMWDKTTSKKAYPTRESFMWALVPFLRDEIRRLSKTSVAIVQIDDPNLCLFVDPEYRSKFEDPAKECDLAVALINSMVENMDGVAIAVHLCRSSGTRNRKITNKATKGFVGEGSYDYILPFIKKLQVDQLAMEFAVPGSGDFAILKKLPTRFAIGIGCVDCRSTVFDTADTIINRVEKAMKYIDKERILLNPDCGFAPGNQSPVQLDQAYLKLQEMKKAADQLRNKYK